MKYILCEYQDYEDLTRYALECDDVKVSDLQKYLKKSGDFGEVVAVLETKPFSFDKLIIANTWIEKEIKNKIKEVKIDQKKWNKAKLLTQKMLDEEYQRKKAAYNAMVAGVGGNVTFAMPIYIRSHVEEIQKDARANLRRSKKLLSILMNLTKDE